MTINETIEKALQIEDEEEGKLHDPTKGFYISGLGLCLKGAYYQRLGAKAPYSPDKLRIFKLGNVLEETVFQLFESADVIHSVQQTIEYPEYDLRGRYDFLLKMPDGTMKLVEMKTMNSRGWTVMEHGKEPAKVHHAIQAALYWNKLKDEYPGLQASVLYVNKDTFQMYEAELTPEQLDAALKLAFHRAAILKKAWDTKTPPEIEEEAWVSRYCDVHLYCVGVQTMP